MKLSTYPHLVKEWHPTMNGELTPEQIASSSRNNAWWLCKKGHSNKSVIQSRSEKIIPRGCPYCSGRKTLNYDLFKGQK